MSVQEAQEETQIIEQQAKACDLTLTMVEDTAERLRKLGLSRRAATRIALEIARIHTNDEDYDDDNGSPGRGTIMQKAA